MDRYSVIIIIFLLFLNFFTLINMRINTFIRFLSDTKRFACMRKFGNSLVTGNSLRQPGMTGNRLRQPGATGDNLRQSGVTSDSLLYQPGVTSDSLRYQPGVTGDSLRQPEVTSDSL